MPVVKAVAVDDFDRHAVPEAVPDALDDVVARAVVDEKDEGLPVPVCDTDRTAVPLAVVVAE